MSRVLTPEEMQKALSRAQQGASRATEPPRATPVSGGEICLSARPQMPPGWLNTKEGSTWMINRVESFARMDTGGQMNFGFLPKNAK